ncbi:MAG: MBL fold metallo-hydrolase [Cyclobacteriaceae bacterium]|nr:MBL fold metallo-hydrolase [Cyclobacteriaceae bacterium]
MIIHQFEDKNLAHYSYAIVSKGEMAVIDPARNPQPYYDFAISQKAKITTVIETHPHADFVSSHLEIHQAAGATIYVSRLLGAEYPHQTFDEGEAIVLGDVTLKALNTPGHSPDSISVVAVDEQGKEYAVFTGDTLFIGDCGRPDLRESAGAITAAREDLARQMYHSLRDKLMKLPDHVLVYPAHGAGSLCGKGLSKQNVSTIGAEKMSNWSLQTMTEANFVKDLLADQPFVPKYFPYAVGINKRGAEHFRDSVRNVKRAPLPSQTEYPIIDARPERLFKKGHHKGAINLMRDTKFETWLGSIVNPGESFYLVAESEDALNELIERIARVGYETQVAGASVVEAGPAEMNIFDPELLRKAEDAFTILDIRNPSEVKTSRIFKKAIHIPLYELRERVGEIPTDKPVVVHCAGGYRSAAGSTIVRSALHGSVPVFDLSEAVKTFQE